MKKMDEGRCERKVRVVTVEGDQGRRRPRFGWLDWVKRALAVKEEGLQVATQLAI